MEKVNGRLGIAGVDHLVAPLAKGRADDIADRRFIVYNQDSCFGAHESTCQLRRLLNWMKLPFNATEHICAAMPTLPAGT